MMPHRAARIPIPIRVEPAVDQLAAIAAVVRDRRVAIVGSAPRAIEGPEPLEVDELAIPVNGGISSTSGSIALWIVGSKPYDGPGHPVRDLHRLMLDQATGRSIAHVVFMRQPAIASEGLTLNVLERRRVTIASYSVVDKPTKYWLETELCARLEKQPCSTGIFAAAAALWCDAAHVRLVGFSLAAGYHYIRRPSPPAAWRDHVDADARALVALRARFGARLRGDVLKAVCAR